ncbi:MAG: U32 family peptidase [Planctomycetes bacterium]|nr:U32 family peptidase [Planctomycetota bacterium]
MSHGARTELLAPAGSQDALDAALAAGADAVYFGLDEGFNARARAANFPRSELGATVARIHRAGAKAYLTLNTLVFEDELAQAEALLRDVAASGVDALIVQDPAIALLAHAICPALEVHASTQMTIANPDAARLAARLHVTRVVVPRELSVEEIRRFREECALELEVFVHGALCVSWSGQCLTSETWGGRSANRGQCAQSCRMPYELVLDGRPRELDDLRYLLSPKDLAGVRAVEELLGLGIEGLKIEGRQKGPGYVGTAVAGYRRWIDALTRGVDRAAAERQLALDLRDMGSSYTRGFSDGFLAGSDHQELVEGRFPKHRGHYLGRVRGVNGDEVEVARDPDGRPWTGAAALATRREPRGEPSSPLAGSAPARLEPPEPRPGMGVVFDDGQPEDDEAGGAIWRVRPARDGWLLGFGRQGPDLARVRAGQRVWLTSDPSVRIATGEPSGRVPLALALHGSAGSPLRIEVAGVGAALSLESAMPLATARGGDLNEALLREKLGAFGGTPFALGALELAGLAAGLYLPVSELKRLRRAIVDGLLPRLERGPLRALAPVGALGRLRDALGSSPATSSRWVAPSEPRLVPLCRSDEQLEAVIAAGLPEVELDWMELAGLGQAVARARSAGLSVVVATLRVTKPGERRFDTRLLDLAPDGILVRHFGALELFAALPPGQRPILHGDFSLNVTNGLSAAFLLGTGLDTVTPSHDLDAPQLEALLRAMPAARATLALHVRMPTFHTEHCVHAHLLSEGRDFRSCGRPCERHAIALRDRLGFEHPVIVDAGCRNTVFNGTLQTAAGVLGAALRLGARRLRLEFVREDGAAVTGAIAAYRDLLAGRLRPPELQRALRAELRVGVLADARRGPAGTAP